MVARDSVERKKRDRKIGKERERERKRGGEARSKIRPSEITMNTARCFLVQCPSLCRRFYYVHAKRALEMKRRTRLVVRNFIPG